MALIKCKECGAQISSSASSCPQCGKKKPSAGCGILLLILIAIIVVPIGVKYFVNSSVSRNNTNSVIAKSPVLETRVDYEVVDSWSIANGGIGKVIVIKPALVDEIGMTALGETLKYDCMNNKNSFVYVFDNKQAALSRKSVLNETANKFTQKLYDDHFVGSYTKNGNTGLHSFDIFFDGCMGNNNKKITY
jgi:hypothetical protein